MQEPLAVAGPLAQAVPDYWQTRDGRIREIRRVANVFVNAPHRFDANDLASWANWFPSGDDFYDPDLADWSDRLFSAFPAYPTDAYPWLTGVDDPIRERKLRALEMGSGPLTPDARDLARMIMVANRDRAVTSVTEKWLRAQAAKVVVWPTPPIDPAAGRAELEFTEQQVNDRPSEPPAHFNYGLQLFHHARVTEAGRAFVTAESTAYGSLSGEELQQRVQRYASNQNAVLGWHFARRDFAAFLDLIDRGGNKLLYDKRDHIRYAVSLAVMDRWEEALDAIEVARGIYPDADDVFRWQLSLAFGARGEERMNAVWRTKPDYRNAREIAFDGADMIAGYAVAAEKPYLALRHWRRWFLARMSRDMWSTYERQDVVGLLAAHYRSMSPKPGPGPEATPHIDTAQAHMRAGQVWEALTAYLAALDESPWWADGYFNVGLLAPIDVGRGTAANYMDLYLALEPDGARAEVAQQVRRERHG
jgi:tetratricopeptide (TPR) repeat protein